MTKGGLTQNLVTAYESAYGQWQSSLLLAEFSQSPTAYLKLV